MSVDALNTVPSSDTYVEKGAQIQAVTAELANLQKTGAVMTLPNNGHAANEANRDAAPVTEINTGHCLTSDVAAVSLMPGVDPQNNPIDTLELNEVNPVPPGGMTPMLGLQVIDEVCEHTKGMIVDNNKAANDEAYNTVQPGLQEQQLAVQTRYYEQAQALEQSGPTPT